MSSRSSSEILSPVDAQTQAEPGPAAPRQPPLRETSALALTGLLLIALLLLQFIYHERDLLVRFPQTLTVIERVCAYLPCTPASARAPDQFHLVARGVRDHPEVAGALEITGTFSNGADFPQEYPVVELRFTDINGQPVAIRRFAPEEYLTGIASGAGMVVPGANVAMMIEILDPGPRAVAYEFSFL